MIKYQALHSSLSKTHAFACVAKLEILHTIHDFWMNTYNWALGDRMCWVILG